MERRQKFCTLYGNNSSANFSKSWPPSSFSPKLSTPSTANDFNANQSAVNSGALSVYNWPLSCSPSLVAEADSLIRQINDLAKNVNSQ